MMLQLQLIACGGGDSNNQQVTQWPIAANVYTTAEQQILPYGLPAIANWTIVQPSEIPKYEELFYSKYYTGPGLNYVRRADIAPGNTATNAARLLTFFTMTDIHITDKESPAQVPYIGWGSTFGSNEAGAYSPVMLTTTHVLDAAVQTVNALHKKTPFNFGIALGDAVNNTQYNELRWYIDVLDGKVITPSSGAHLGADSIDYQKPYKAAGLNKAIPWYQAIGNHDQYMSGVYYEFDKTMAAHIGSSIININSSPAVSAPSYDAIRGQGYYMGVVDGTNPYGYIIGSGPMASYTTPPSVVADPDRRTLATASSSSVNWIAEFFNTTSNPVGHGFNLVDPANGPGFASYSFMPKSDIPIKVIVLDDTCKGSAAVADKDVNYVAGCLDQQRFDWLKAELLEGQTNNKLMIIAAHIPVHPYASLTDSQRYTNTFPLPPTVVNDANLLAELHKYPNLILWIAGHRHLNVVTPQPKQGDATGEYGFWEVETSSLRDFPQQFRTFDIRRNTDNTISIITTNVDPAVSPGSPAYKSRGYAIGAARIYGGTDAILADTTSQAYNAELVKQLTPTMKAIISGKGTPL